MTTLATRKRIELQAKLAALPEELKAWRTLSQDAAAPFAKHHTQIRRLGAQIEGLHSLVADELDALATDDALLQRGRTIEQRLLAVHAVWDYFRSRLVLRTQEPFAPFLAAADAFAWACYQPMLDTPGAAAGHAREPPLVALQGTWSPNALPRGHAYDVVRSPGGWTDSAPFAAVIRDLPVPIVGVPWLHLEHLPHLVLVAHEVGHLVEQDFGLAARVLEVVTATLPGAAGARPAWTAWRAEIFADVFACAAAGPAFGWSLADVLARQADDIAGETVDEDEPGDYPPSTVRIQLNAAALAALGFAAEAGLLLEAWSAAYPADASTSLVDEARRIAGALVASDVLPQALRFSLVAGQYTRAVNLLEAQFPLQDDVLQDPRALVAAACEHYRKDPAAPGHADSWRAVRRRIVEARPPGVLDAAGGATGSGGEPIDLVGDRAAGRAAGGAFFTRLDDEG